VKLGLFGINMHACSRPDAVARVARAAEAAGFESLWAGEHVVLPDPQVPPSPMAPQERALDPIVALTYAAAQTERLRLGTGIIILPQRNPLVLAKELASLDVLSVGRLIFGVGVGYLEPEFQALGIPMADRARRTIEYLEAIRSLWQDEHPSFHGTYVDFAGVDAHPRPLQRPVPIVIGGHTPAAYRRAVRHAHGWYGFALTPEAAADCLEGLRAAAAEHGVERPAELGPLEITVTPRGRLTAERASEWAELAVDRLVLLAPPTADVAAIESLITDAAVVAATTWAVGAAEQDQ
jgi:probable F420-dependent oxidoreductase